MNFPSICNNIPAAPAYGVYFSQLIRYSRACGAYYDFPDRGVTANNEATEPKGSKWFMFATMTWLIVTEYMCHKPPRLCSFCRNHNPVLSSFMINHRVCNTTGATYGAGTANSSGAPFINLEGETNNLICK